MKIISMNQKTKFLIFCIEEYKNAKKLTGKQVIALFAENSIMDFILDCYGALHTEGVKAIIWEIDDYIANRKAS
ncbi:MAG: DUF3791 domain-containing protein [Elusimicrobiota bacterium]|jgi:hypothetical protein|nr:DUF3791 domain-containing protein [Elusimicrobiota bacterium]